MKNIQKIYICLLLLFGAVGCGDQLDLNNPNNQVPADFWQTESHALEGINAVYTALIIDGTYMRMIPALTDGRGDDFQQDTPWLDLAQVANFSALPSTGPIQWLWHAHFQIVFRANQVLENVPPIDMDDELKNRIVGQAHFLRGLAYFNLVTNFQRVPLITSVPIESAEFYPATASEEELWSQITADFEQAKQLLPISYLGVGGPDNNQVGRATRGAAAGMKGKALLYQRRWAEATTEFEFVVGLGIYGLVDNFRENFGFNNENNRESLFEIQFATPDRVGGNTYNYGGEPNANWMQVSSVGHTYAQPGFGYNDFVPSRGLYDAFHLERTVDGRKDPRLLSTIASYEPEENSTTVYNGVPWPHAQDAIFPRKYTHDGLGVATESQGGVERSGINYRVLRYADILLMHAEALNELGRTAEAYDFIQMVRDRANLPSLSVVRPNMNQNQMKDQIAHERFLEFAIESLRIHDIIRWGWFYDSEKLAMLRANDVEFTRWSPGKEYLPIPQTELDVNPNLLPNDAN
ncbi:RagB/SusD family nutrient uptake outer membrane protein [Anditalea andensis]|uniref:SusD/RagB family protein n=1 Tax=Anditalea andensis TaxID=1048983 RepID=A0A074KWR8_9BACT|nr:RagB/SusD family nutrient uptake outer membrane protein [Anditalea andensis]KEO74431.1 SusD/RagB family protein [Anditalea andensis]